MAGLVDEVVAAILLVDAGHVLEGAPREPVALLRPRAAVGAGPHEPVGGGRALVAPGGQGRGHPRHQGQDARAGLRLGRPQVVAVHQVLIDHAVGAGDILGGGHLHELAVYGESAFLEVDPVPGEAEAFALPHSLEEGGDPPAGVLLGGEAAGALGGEAGGVGEGCPGVFLGGGLEEGGGVGGGHGLARGGGCLGLGCQHHGVGDPVPLDDCGLEDAVEDESDVADRRR